MSFLCIKAFNPFNNPMRWVTKYYSRFTNEATEAKIKKLAKVTQWRKQVLNSGSSLASSYIELLRKGTRAYVRFYPAQNLTSLFMQSSKKFAKMPFWGRVGECGERGIFNYSIILSQNSV